MIYQATKFRGYDLPNMPRAELLKEYHTPAWAFRFLQTMPEVTVTLSGMFDMEQLQANIFAFRKKRLLSEEEMDTLLYRADGIDGCAQGEASFSMCGMPKL